MSWHTLSIPFDCVHSASNVCQANMAVRICMSVNSSKQVITKTPTVKASFTSVLENLSCATLLRSRVWVIGNTWEFAIRSDRCWNAQSKARFISDLALGKMRISYFSRTMKINGNGNNKRIACPWTIGLLTQFLFVMFWTWLGLQ